MAEELGASAVSETVSSQTAVDEVGQYLSLTNVPLQHCPLAWWRSTVDSIHTLRNWHGVICLRLSCL